MSSSILLFLFVCQFLKPSFAGKSILMCRLLVLAVALYALLNLIHLFQGKYAPVTNLNAPMASAFHSPGRAMVKTIAETRPMRRNIVEVCSFLFLSKLFLLKKKKWRLLKLVVVRRLVPSREVILRKNSCSLGHLKKKKKKKGKKTKGESAASMLL